MVGLSREPLFRSNMTFFLKPPVRNWPVHEVSADPPEIAAYRQGGPLDFHTSRDIALSLLQHAPQCPAEIPYTPVPPVLWQEYTTYLSHSIPTKTKGRQQTHVRSACAPPRPFKRVWQKMLSTARASVVRFAGLSGSARGEAWCSTGQMASAKVR